MIRMRWTQRILAGVLAVGAAGGCKQHVFMEPADYKDAVMSALPRGLETEPHSTITPSVVDPVTPGGPGDVINTVRPSRMVTLKECIAIALEQGNIGSTNTTNFGFITESIETQAGRTIGGSDTIKVFAIDPAIQAVSLERSLSKFDARWINSVSWQKFDQPVAAQFLSFQNSRDVANLTSTLAKPLPTGGTAGITFQTDYQKFDTRASNGFVNPNYVPQVQFTFEQPLLRLFGVEANLLSPAHPGSQLLNLAASGGGGTEGILISRIRVDQAKAEFDTRVNFMLVNVETAYWNLYAAYYNLYAQEEGMRQAFEGYRFIKIRVETGNQPPQDAYQARAQFERFRRQVYQARGQVLESERQLRGLLGLRSDDGFRLIPIDQPNETPFRPDFYEAANESLSHRPELLQARETVKANQLNLLLQQNLRRPDLRSFGQYNIAGLGTRLDGSENLANGIPGNALSSLTSNQFNSWTIGFRLDMPLGFRDANGLVRDAQLNLARSYFQLRDAERKALEYLALQYRQVIQAHAEIGPAREERMALQIYLGKIKEVIELGRWDSAYYQQYLQVQRDLATSIAQEFRAIANYNSALAALEFAKGTSQQYNNVTVNEGPLPPWAQKKAADHIRERTEAALKLRERECLPPPAGPGAVGGTTVNPPVGSALIGNITLPPFAEKRDPVPDTLPDPLPVDPKKNPKALPSLPSGIGMSALPVGSSRMGFPPPVQGAPVTDATAGEPHFEPIGTVVIPKRVPIAGTAAPTAPGATQVPLPAAPPTPPLPVPPPGPAMPAPGR
ncbi:outer membrane efflux protein : Outer membrane efflux protein OS=Rhodopirellula sp. SWK7 GN=RRSWK_02756 PE=4 SV=1: OEP [Gemmataceae bacterium]|nr:outer membrane efflux protein : Outer membrane efflux protein OS=Rhodopirellula sp. SWK7 GN=RRSWK_02756 PE=4 SV=1: OEP [Gemmataceae bacterium]VTU00265.1 outer membrane efflux protein : Outer membrane efflux protein OS=Rhodopirellula sp. SWK7 GN=RRSWK_02756 PE=4 SV=1: OEP [Gemmataceae bacterium]